MSKTNVLRQKQYTTEVANKSRLITKVRWVVERANGRINQWIFLDKVVPNRLVKYIGDFVKIVCAILNWIRPRALSIDTASNEIANEILRKANMDNELKMYLEQNNLIKEKQLQPNWKHRSHADWFSKTKSRWNTGNYNGCISNEYLTEDGLYEEAIGIIKVKFQSLHSKNVAHSMDSICERSSQTYYRLVLHT